MKKKFFQVLVPLVLFLAVIVMARAVWRMWQRNQLAQNNLASSLVNLEQLSKRKSLLEQKISKMKTPRGVEEELRVSFAVIKPGEKVINIVDDSKATTAPTTTLPTKAWWQIF